METDEARDQLNIILAKAGWRFDKATPSGPLHVKYVIVRTADGRTAEFTESIPSLVMDSLRTEELTVDLPYIKINPFLAIRLSLLAREENAKNPVKP